MDPELKKAHLKARFQALRPAILQCQRVAVDLQIIHLESWPRGLAVRPNQ